MKFIWGGRSFGLKARSAERSLIFLERPFTFERIAGQRTLELQDSRAGFFGTHPKFHRQFATGESAFDVVILPLPGYFVAVLVERRLQNSLAAVSLENKVPFSRYARAGTCLKRKCSQCA